MTPTRTPTDGAGECEALTREHRVWELQGDLATVSCHAATEIDDLLLGRPKGFEAVTRLVETLRDSLVSVSDPASPRSLMDPTTAVAVNYALLDSDPQMTAPLRTIDEVVREAKRVADGLARLVDSNVQDVQPEQRTEIERLRLLCLSLSNRALAFEEPLDEIEPEPDESQEVIRNGSSNLRS